MATKKKSTSDLKLAPRTKKTTKDIPKKKVEKLAIEEPEIKMSDLINKMKQKIL